MDLELFLDIFSGLPQGYFQEQGLSLYWNDKELETAPYNKIEKHYYCGRELLQFTEGKTLMYCILVVDLDECYLADVFSDGEVVKLYADTSMVPKKQGQGGQSQPRFQANRANEIVHWFKGINEVLKMYDRQIVLGINWIHYKKFLSYLNTYNQAKVVQQISAEYSGLAGVYDVINRLERAKQHPKG